ncbi:hypothetical protein B566_EDAN008207 [Ephemera danica]|nr:hypothetical protein B566_EDAN008207 [Ephemera danica]
MADMPIRSTTLWDSISFTSPNFKELRVMAAATGATVTTELPTEPEEILEESLRLAHHLAKQGVETVVNYHRHSLAAAMAVGFTRGFPEWRGVTWGMAAAGLSLHSPLAVPSQLQNLEPPQRPISPAAALPLI